MPANKWIVRFYKGGKPEHRFRLQSDAIKAARQLSLESGFDTYVYKDGEKSYYGYSRHQYGDYCRTK